MGSDGFERRVRQELRAWLDREAPTGSRVRRGSTSGRAFRPIAALVVVALLAGLGLRFAGSSANQLSGGSPGATAVGGLACSGNASDPYCSAAPSYPSAGGAGTSASSSPSMAPGSAAASTLPRDTAAPVAAASAGAVSSGPAPISPSPVQGSTTAAPSTGGPSGTPRPTPATTSGSRSTPPPVAIPTPRPTPHPTIAPTQSPSPAAPQAVVVTVADQGATIQLVVGQQLLLELGSAYDWSSVTVSQPQVLAPGPGGTLPAGAQARYVGARSGTSTLQATGDPTCRKVTPPCGAPSILFSVTIVVH